MNQQKTGGFLRQLRKEKGITQEQLAEQLNVTGRTVSRWETGSNMPDISLLAELAEFYDVGISEIIDGERKSGKMNPEIKETAQKMADYADAEKAKLLAKARVFSCAGLAALIVALAMESANPNSPLPLYEACKGFCFGLAAGALVLMVLYTTGLLGRFQGKRQHKLFIAGAFALAGILLAAVFSFFG